jgi:hypothetical protein
MDISSFIPATAAINSSPTKHQISVSHSCLPQLLFHSSRATTAFQKLQPKQTGPKWRSHHRVFSYHQSSSTWWLPDLLILFIFLIVFLKLPTELQHKKKTSL